MIILYILGICVNRDGIILQTYVNETIDFNDLAQMTLTFNRIKTCEALATPNLAK